MMLFFKLIKSVPHKFVVIPCCLFRWCEENVLTCNIRASTNFTHSQTCHFVSHYGWKQELLFQLRRSKSTMALRSVTSLIAIIEHSLLFGKIAPFNTASKNLMRWGWKVCITNWHFNKRKFIYKILQQQLAARQHRSVKKKNCCESRMCKCDLTFQLLYTSYQDLSLDLFQVPHLRVSIQSYLANAGVAISDWTPMAMGMPPQLMFPSSSATATL